MLKLGFYSFKLPFEKFGPIKISVLNFSKPFFLCKSVLPVGGRERLGGGGGRGEGYIGGLLKTLKLNYYMKHNTKT